MRARAEIFHPIKRPSAGKRQMPRATERRARLPANTKPFRDASRARARPATMRLLRNALRLPTRPVARLEGTPWRQLRPFRACPARVREGGIIGAVRRRACARAEILQSLKGALLPRGAVWWLRTAKKQRTLRMDRSLRPTPRRLRPDRLRKAGSYAAGLTMPKMLARDTVNRRASSLTLTPAA